MTSKAELTAPYRDAPINAFIRKRIDALASVKSQKEIAIEMGYEKANILSMFKTGDAKVPLDKIPALANALEVDPALLFRMAMLQYWPDMERVVRSVFGDVITKNERDIVHLIREFTDGGDPPVTPELKSRLQSVFA